MAGQDEPVMVENAAGKSDFVILCDHACNAIPKSLADLGLGHDALESHIAWDPGALEVCEALSARLDAVLIYATVSRLVIDCNRMPDAPDLIPKVSETTAIPGNAELDAAERDARIECVHRLYHAAIDAVLDARAAQGRQSLLVAVHSYTPVYKGVARPWHVGILSDRDRRLADGLLAELGRDAALVVADNQPYSPQDGVYYTLALHGEARGLASVMIEIRNDEIASKETQLAWAERLAVALASAREAVIKEQV
nr:N-formylglutamate amidohydrolase [Breoghania corrubedonensis]